jgi:hypothetical protein
VASPLLASIHIGASLPPLSRAGAKDLAASGLATRQQAAWLLPASLLGSRLRLVGLLGSRLRLVGLLGSRLRLVGLLGSRLRLGRLLLEGLLLGRLRLGRLLGSRLPGLPPVGLLDGAWCPHFSICK